jgi:hypothetical protein
MGIREGSHEDQAVREAQIMAGQFTVTGASKADIAKIRRRLQLLSSALAQALFKGSYPSEAALIAERGEPKEGWNYFNSSIGQTLTFHKGAWYQYTIDGENGSAVDFKGEFTVAPLDPVTDDAYLDTVDGVIYIYNGVAWEIMSQSGGLIVVTYHDSNLDATPVPATGTGEADGWHLDATEDVNWLAQQYNAGDWGTPIPAANLTGAVGPAGPAGPDGEDGTDGSGDSIDVPRLSGITFIADGAGAVGWSAGELIYNGTTYNIAALAAGSGRLGKYLYWNLNGTTTTFVSTNTIENSYSAGRWPMCFNEDNIATPAAANKIIIGALLKVETLAAINADCGTLTAGDITALTISATKMTVGTLQAGVIFSSSLTDVNSDGLYAANSEFLQSAISTSTSYDENFGDPWTAGAGEFVAITQKIHRTNAGTFEAEQITEIGLYDGSGDIWDWANYSVDATQTLTLDSAWTVAFINKIATMEADLVNGEIYLIRMRSKLSAVGAVPYQALTDVTYHKFKSFNVDK